MNINQETIDLIKEFEGLRLTAYKDSVGVWTIGYGTTAAADVGITPHAGLTITEDQAEEYLFSTLTKFAAQIAPLITASTNDNQFGAMLSLAYNVGPTAFSKSTLLKKFNAGDVLGAADQFKRWNKAGGKVLNGLVRRRAAEEALFLSDMPVEAPKQRDTPAKSTTLQATCVAAAGGLGTGATAISKLDGVAQYMVVGFLGLIALSLVWIARERLRKWAEGDQ